MFVKCWMIHLVLCHQCWINNNKMILLIYPAVTYKTCMEEIAFVFCIKRETMKFRIQKLRNFTPENIQFIVQKYEIYTVNR